MKILLIGPQGSGKSTQGKLLADYLHIPYISTGDIFRDIARQDTEEGEKIRQILEAGRLVDDQTTSGMVEKKTRQLEYQDGYIFDGYPRNLEQIKLFDPSFNKVFYLKLSDEEATSRLIERAREDDTSQLIAGRLRIYHQETDPLLDYYLQKGLLISIDGQGTIDEIQQKIREELNGQK